MGWKLMEKQKGKFLTSTRHFPIRFARWLRAKNGKIGWTPYDYEQGFHIFETRAAARAYGGGTPVRVKYRNVVARGRQYEGDCIVAKEVLFIKPKGK